MKTNRRIIKPCCCNYRQKDGTRCGYDVARWAANRKKPWVHICICPSIKDVREIVGPLETVLVRCRGCGDEVLREHPKA